MLVKPAAISTFLSSLPLFSGTNEALLYSTVEKYAEIAEFPVGSEIYSPKSKEKTLGVLLWGVASVFSANENNDVHD